MFVRYNGFLMLRPWKHFKSDWLFKPFVVVFSIGILRKLFMKNSYSGAKSLASIQTQFVPQIQARTSLNPKTFLFFTSERQLLEPIHLSLMWLVLCCIEAIFSRYQTFILAGARCSCCARSARFRKHCHLMLEEIESALVKLSSRLPTSE